MRFRLAFWAENISPVEIERDALPLLIEYNAGVACALPRERVTGENALALKRIQEAGVEVSFWPLAGECDGYWPNERNASTFVAYVDELLEWASAHGFRPDRVAFDMEIPLEMMRALRESSGIDGLKCLAAILREDSDRTRFEASKEIFSAAVTRLRVKGITVEAAILPWVALEIYEGTDAIQDLTETPVSGIPWDSVSPMWYSSMIEGMTDGHIKEADGDSLAYMASVMLRSRLGKAASISLGATGCGVLGGEKVFDRPEDLVAGLSGALSAGIRDVSVYSLEGVLERPDPRAWFAALREARPKVPPHSAKAKRIITGARYVIPAIDRIHRLLDEPDGQ
jgi:hypothetical protein